MIVDVQSWLLAGVGAVGLMIDLLPVFAMVQLTSLPADLLLKASG
jgi:hypothetical protein